MHKARTRQSVRFEFQHRLADGSLRDVEVFSATVRAKEREILHSIVHDITDRKQAEEALWQSENYYRAIFEISGTAMFMIDQDTKIRHVNSNFENVSGFSRKEIENKKSWTEFVHPDDVDWMEKRHYLRRQDPDAAPRQYEFRFINRYGEELSVLLAVDMIPGTSQSIASASDITARKRTEEALRESEQKYKQLFEYSPVSLWELDFSQVKRRIDAMKSQGIEDVSSCFLEQPDLVWDLAALVKVRDVNQQTLYLYKATSKDELLSGITKVFGKETHKDFMQTFLVIDKRESGFVSERDHVTLDGQELKVNLYWSVISGYEKDYSRVLVCFVDMTETKRIQEELFQAKEQAEAANRAKSEFLANMSHEIRTPLNGIMGMHQLLQTTDLDDEQNEYLEMAHKASRRLNKLLSDILDLSRIESGKMELKEEEIILEEVKQSVEDIFRHICRENSNALQIILEDNVPERLIGDSIRLTQILFNLVGNAIKYTRQGNIQVQASMIPGPVPNFCRILFIVEDTGQGIAEDKLDLVFETFSQAEGSDSSYARQFEGSGLGLSLVKRLVHLMGGNACICSQTGQGTSVYVSLPFKVPDGLHQEAQGLQRRIPGLRHGRLYSQAGGQG